MNYNMITDEFLMRT